MKLDNTNGNTVEKRSGSRVRPVQGEADCRDRKRTWETELEESGRIKMGDVYVPNLVECN